MSRKLVEWVIVVTLIVLTVTLFYYAKNLNRSSFEDLAKVNVGQNEIV